MIRRFEKLDMEAVLQIWLEGNLQAHPFIPTSYWKSHLDMMRNVLPQSEVYVYSQEGKVIAFVGLDQNYIAGIFIRKEWRSQGIGSRLLAFLKERKSGLTLSVYQKNERACCFYLKENFQIKEENIDQSTDEKEYLMEWNSACSL